MPRLRVEFCALGTGRGRLGGQVDEPAAEILSSLVVNVGWAPTPLDSRLTVPSEDGTVFARVTSIDGAIYLAVGASPDPGSEPRLLLLPGRAQILHVKPGQSLAAIAAERNLTSDSGSLTLADRSGTLLLGGSAQQACPANQTRRLLVIGNPDRDRPLWFSIVGLASAGCGSLQIGPGGTFVFDGLVPDGAVSIFGRSAGQAYTVQEA